MRQIGRIDDAEQAARLVDYLLTKGIRCKIETDGGASVIWVYEEDHLSLAREIIREFLADPQNEKFVAAARLAHELRNAQQKVETDRARAVVHLRSRWEKPKTNQAPLTIVLVLLSVGITFSTNFGDLRPEAKGRSLLSRLLLTSPSRIILPGVELVIPDEDGKPVMVRPARPQLDEIKHGQVWRLLTPIFLHFSPWHLLLNMFTLFDIGRYLESRRGTPFLLLFVLIVGPVSNLIQYWWPWSEASVFGGMSGVLFGMIGYLWIKTQTDPTSNIYLPPNSFIYAMVFLGLGLMNAIPGLANGCHVGGLLAGIAMGFTPRWNRFR